MRLQQPPPRHLEVGTICRQEKKQNAHFALFPVQVELVLTDGHGPDGLDQRVAGIPRVDNQARLSERSLRHRLPAVGGADERRGLEKSNESSVTSQRAVQN